MKDLDATSREFDTDFPLVCGIPITCPAEATAVWSLN